MPGDVAATQFKHPSQIDMPFILLRKFCFPAKTYISREYAWSQRLSFKRGYFISGFRFIF
jgi:hypothetical protein